MKNEDKIQSIIADLSGVVLKSLYQEVIRDNALAELDKLEKAIRENT